MSISHRSLAQLTFGREGAEISSEFASGFYAVTQDYGTVCVTCAHVVRQRKKIFIHGESTSVVFDAYGEHGVDVALLAIPPSVAHDPGVRYHKLGFGFRPNRLYYSLGWSPVAGHDRTLTMVKIWGPRTKRKSMMEPGGEPHFAWELRNDVPNNKEGRAFSSSNFAPGWSGAPVFNVRQSIEEDRVIGILSVVTLAGGEALGISIEKLDFLRPVEEQTGEARLVRKRRSAVQRQLDRLFNKEEYELRFQDDDDSDSLWERRFEEITNTVVSPVVRRPPRSLYDELL